MNNLSFIAWGLSLIAIVVFIILAIVQYGKKDKVKGKKHLKQTGISAVIMVVSFIVFMATSEPLEVEKEEDNIASNANVDDTENEKAEKPKEETPEEKATREAKEAEEKVLAEQKAKEEAEAKVKEDSIPREHKSALKKAESYAKTMDMSKAAIYDQLTSEYGENFPAEAAQYAIDNLEWDWKANALEKAKSYAETMDMSDSAIYDQLISEYGEKFTPEEAQYAIDNL